MQTITTIGLDIAKSVFQVHGVDAAGAVVIRRQLKRRSVLAFFQKLPPCLVGIEARASSHHWSRELQALGHTVRLMPPAYVKPFSNRPFGVKRFQTIYQFSVDVARGPSLLFGIGTKALPRWDQKNEEEQSKWRPCCRTNSRHKGFIELTSSIVPRGTSFHRSVARVFSYRI